MRSTGLRRAIRPAIGIPSEIAGFARVAGDTSSLLRYSGDVLLYRALKLRTSRRPRHRHIRLRGGVHIEYRLDRGDVQAIREVWIDEVYRLPIAFSPNVVVDFGAHIGIASLWFHRTYGCRRIVAVEPSPQNAALLRRNVAINRAPIDVVEAAVGPSDGTAFFSEGRSSILGDVSKDGTRVRVISPASVIARLGGSIDLVKMDIEGGEGALLKAGDWLSGVKALIVEFHPEKVDYRRLAAAVEQSGFDFIPVGAVLPKSTDFFFRPELDP